MEREQRRGERGSHYALVRGRHTGLLLIIISLLLDCLHTRASTSTQIQTGRFLRCTCILLHQSRTTTYHLRPPQIPRAAQSPCSDRRPTPIRRDPNLNRLGVFPRLSRTNGPFHPRIPYCIPHYFLPYTLLTFLDESTTHLHTYTHSQVRTLLSPLFSVQFSFRGSFPQLYPHGFTRRKNLFPLGSHHLFLTYA